MAIFRITVRTFQNDEHAALFLAITEQAITALKEKGIISAAKERGFNVVKKKLNQAPFYFSKLIEFEKNK